MQVNNTVQDWPLVATIIGRGFSGPSKMIAKARSTTQYPLTFHPLYLGSVEVSSAIMALFHPSFLDLSYRGPGEKV